MRKHGLLIGLLALAVVLIVASLGVRASRTAKDREAVLAQVTEIVAANDPVVVALDAAVASETTTMTAEENAGLVAKLDPTIEELRKAKRMLADSRGGIASKGKARAAALEDAIDGRLSMLRTGAAILSIDSSASAAIEVLDRAWKALLEADAHSNAAVAASNLHTPEGVATSTIENVAALDLLNRAKEMFAAASDVFPSEEIDKAVAYVDAKIAANAIARDGDAALQAGNVEAANQLSIRYNEAQTAAITLAQELAADPREMIKQTYDTKIADLIDEYGAARSTTAEADARLRD